MAFTFPSEAWIKELSHRLNQSTAYERCARDWEGDIIFVVEADEALKENDYLFLGLHHGKSTGAERLDTEDARDVEFVIRAPFTVWRRVIEGEMDPIRGLMTRRLKLSGNLMKIMRYPKAAQEIVSCCAEVPTDWD